MLVVHGGDLLVASGRRNRRVLRVGCMAHLAGWWDREAVAARKRREARPRLRGRASCDVSCSTTSCWSRCACRRRAPAGSGVRRSRRRAPRQTSDPHGVRRPLSGSDPHDRRAPSSDHDRGAGAPAGRRGARVPSVAGRWTRGPCHLTSESVVEADRDRGGRYGTRPGRAPRSAAWRDLLVGVAAVKPLMGSFVHAANTLAGMPFAERDEREVQPMLVASRREHEPEGSLRSRSRRDRHVDLQQAGEPRAVGSIISATLNIGQGDAPILQAAPLALRRRASG